MNEDTGITVHAFIRPGTPGTVGREVLSQIVDLHNFGIVGVGSKIWVNFDIPHAMWLLSDISTFLHVAVVPTAGWVRLTRTSVAWARLAPDTSRNPTFSFTTNDVPMPVQPHDTITVALRNGDPARMRAQFGGTHHAMPNYEISHGQMRAIDFKRGSSVEREPLAQPSEFDVNHAGIRGLDLMSATTGPHMHRVIRRNLPAFTNVLKIEEFYKVQGAQSRISEIADTFTAPIIADIAKLGEVGPFSGYSDDSSDDYVDEQSADASKTD